MVALPKRESVSDRPRLRRRLWLSAVLLVGGLLAIAFALVPQPWRDVVSAGLDVARAWLASLGALVVALALGISLLLVATLVLLVPRRIGPQEVASASFSPATSAFAPSMSLPAPSSTLVQVNGIAPVSVYLDLENQISKDQAVQFVAAVRKYVGHRAADLYFYSNAAATAGHKVYKALWKYGFRPIDVPYKHLGVKSAKNIVDVDLSLHAYHRAAFGPANQDILLITEDQDYLPLVFRLRTLGHQVTIWASKLPVSYKQLQSYLGIAYQEFGAEFGNSPSTAASPTLAKRPSSMTSQPAPLNSSTSRSLPAASLVTVRGAIQWVPRIIEGIPDDVPDPFNRLTQKLGTVDGDILARLGHRPISRSKRVLRWLEQLDALGVIKLTDSEHLPGLGTISPDEAAKTLEQFLAAITEALTARAQAPEGDRIPLAEACTLVTQAPTTQDGTYLRLRRLIAPAEPMPRTAVSHMRHLLETAQALGMLTFENTEYPDVIRVIVLTAPAG